MKNVKRRPAALGILGLHAANLGGWECARRWRDPLFNILSVDAGVPRHFAPWLPELWERERTAEPRKPG